MVFGSNFGLSNPTSFDSKTIKHFFIKIKHLFSAKNSTQNFFLTSNVIFEEILRFLFLFIKKFQKKKQIKDGQTWSDVTRCGHLWSDVVICGQMF